VWIQTEYDPQIEVVTNKDVGENYKKQWRINEGILDKKYPEESQKRDVRLVEVPMLIKSPKTTQKEDKKRKSIINKIKEITKQNKFLLAIVGVALLAASVNVVELVCSIGLPMMFTSILSVNDLSTIQYFLYIFLYIFFFLLIDIIIFTIAVVTFKVTGISTKFTKYSHLIGGIIMILIGFFLILQWY
jgi:hypothetical protein